jgi:hypothetical protein
MFGISEEEYKTAPSSLLSFQKPAVGAGGVMPLPSPPLHLIF